MYSAVVTRPMLRLLFVATAVFAVLSHVCALPAHAHVAIVSPVIDEHDATDPHDSSESLHAASCEAIVNASNALPSPVSVLVLRPLDSWAALGRERLMPVVDRPPAESPPLFLLHAALLI
ncbi:MAG: hypothetical protein DMD91_34795 [Candidatus Rokuibacteriota bacterium]|nr:MAG: hypothetical protein DMD91_34795 [Candidatus Rokubacteria bacterium]